jgi:hypothetical protein
MGKDGAALPLDHQIPHGRDGRLAPALVGNLSIVRDEVELSATMAEATLLDFMAAHEGLSLLGFRCARLGRVREM